jgi:hypothetical protein
MLVEQAIFTSADTSRVRGYQLIARSSGIAADKAAELSMWSPSHNSLLAGEANAESLNYHPLKDASCVVSRTMYGGREFSQRSGLQVVTLLLVLTPEQFRRYENNAVVVARVARSLGHLRWQPASSWSPSLPPVELPDGPASELSMGISNSPINKEVEAALYKNESIALLTSVPGQRVESLIRSITIHRRSELSFTTGLKPTKQRPFRIHLMPAASIDSEIRIKLDSLRLRCFVS